MADGSDVEDFNLVRLQLQHRKLDEKIREGQKEGSRTDPLALTAMKRQKLLLKDQIAELGGRTIT